MFVAFLVVLDIHLLVACFLYYVSRLSLSRPLELLICLSSHLYDILLQIVLYELDLTKVHYT